MFYALDIGPTIDLVLAQHKASPSPIISNKEKLEMDYEQLNMMETYFPHMHVNGIFVIHLVWKSVVILYVPLPQ